MKVQDILDALSSSEIVQEVVVIVLVQEPGKQALRAKATLKGGYILHINEALGIGFRSYSYHILKGDKMVRRYFRQADIPATRGQRRSCPNGLSGGVGK